MFFCLLLTSLFQIGFFFDVIFWSQSLLCREAYGASLWVSGCSPAFVRLKYLTGVRKRVWVGSGLVFQTWKSILQHHSSKASILWCSAFFRAQLSHPYMTTGKIIALIRWTFVDKIMSLIFNMLSRLVITFLSRTMHLLISWLQLPSSVILEPKK